MGEVAGRRPQGATEAIPDELIDQLVVHGSPEECRAHLQRYVDNGITTPAPAILAGPDDARRLIRALAPERIGDRRCVPGAPSLASGDRTADLLGATPRH